MKKIVNGNDDYDIFFHYRIAADRTGTLVYLLEGVLGVPLNIDITTKMIDYNS